jgi:hypothetical protein
MKLLVGYFANHLKIKQFNHQAIQQSTISNQPEPFADKYHFLICGRKRNFAAINYRKLFT